jgi:ectoine hydroxylase-related dioxygenase (phytanoyl-CoA dioxygenase family)
MHPKIVDAVESLIGPDIAIFTTRVLSKPAGTGRAVPWHQDADYWPLEPPEAVSFWLAIDDVDGENGAMRVLPGAHRQGMLPHIKIPRAGNVLDEAIRPEFVEEDKAVTLSMNAGECSFHDIHLPHGSEPNRSTRRRCAFIVRYIPTGSQLRRDRDPSFPEDYPLYLVRGKPGKNRYAN